ncbi:hypothetical protein AB0K00_04180 [Dactylosporangium sp. NPDC049525]|uniref:hypothetical protein n=1 Tax=Dactylosporangium sp. NPDC049525 TaxID=3154730 RepID=UPI003414CE6C
MRFPDIVSRLDGNGTAVYRKNFSPSAADREAARKVIVFLENRRALYESPDRETSDHLIASVLEIRDFLNKLLESAPLAEELSVPLKAITADCRDFLTAAQVDAAEAARIRQVVPDSYDFRLLPMTALVALRALRETAGSSLGLIAAAYGLDVEDHLDVLIPASLP